MGVKRVKHEVAKLEQEQRAIMVRHNWPNNLMAFVDVPPADIDRLRDIQRLLRLDRMLLRTAAGNLGIIETEVVFDRVEAGPDFPEFARAPDSADVACGNAEGPAAHPTFKLGDVVQFKSGGHAMVVEGLDCCGCHALIYSRKGVVEQLDVPGECLQLYDAATDRGERSGDLPF